MLQILINMISGEFFRNVTWHEQSFNSASPGVTPKFMEYMTEVTAERKQRVVDVCQTLRLSKQPTWHYLMADDRHEVVYCFIPKVACSSWKTLIGQMAGHTGPTNSVHERSFLRQYGLKYMDEINYAERNRLISKYNSFIFVRHPFSRLVSGYLNKIAAKTDEASKFHKSHGCTIIKKFRKNYTTKDLTYCDDVTFLEFVEYILYLHGTNREFNRHWKPIHKLCNPCHVRFDFIGKIETMGRDQEYVLRNFFKNSTIKFPQRNASNKNKTSADYMETIPRGHVKQLYEVYKEDFLLFGYDEPW